jgi:hypothetical protein
MLKMNSNFYGSLKPYRTLCICFRMLNECEYRVVSQKIVQLHAYEIAIGRDFDGIRT